MFAIDGTSQNIVGTIRIIFKNTSNKVYKSISFLKLALRKLYLLKSIKFRNSVTLYIQHTWKSGQIIYLDVKMEIISSRKIKFAELYITNKRYFVEVNLISEKPTFFVNLPHTYNSSWRNIIICSDIYYVLFFKSSNDKSRERSWPLSK